MKKTIDNFSEASAEYKKFRPTYPPALYQQILAHTQSRYCCWDCGTGNGQVAKSLAQHFDQVFATDISENQIKQAQPQSNVIYSVSRAESTHFQDAQFDAITVAQAIHWFDLRAFEREVLRVLKPQAHLFIWGYGLVSLEGKIDPIVKRFYTQTIGPYWDKERKYIDEHYQGIVLSLDKIATINSLQIAQSWTLTDFIGYIRTWSSVKKYRKAQAKDPCIELQKALEPFWQPKEEKEVIFPLFMQVWQKT